MSIKFFFISTEIDKIFLKFFENISLSLNFILYFCSIFTIALIIANESISFISRIFNFRKSLGVFLNIVLATKC